MQPFEKAGMRGIEPLPSLGNRWLSRAEVFPQRLFDDGFEGIGDRLVLLSVVDPGKRFPEHPLLREKNWPEDRHAVAGSDFFEMFWRLNNLTLLLVGFPSVIGECKKSTLFVPNER